MKHSRENPTPEKNRQAAADTESSADGGFVSRWARRKRNASVDTQSPDERLQTADTTHAIQSQAAESAVCLTGDLPGYTSGHLSGDLSSGDLSGNLQVSRETPVETDDTPVLTDADMPDIETLNSDSDFSPFFSEGVSKELRNLALKKLFFSGMFSARDGLDDYDDDFTRFEPLGDTVTSDMKFHARRKEKNRLAELEEEQLRLEESVEENSADESALEQELSEAETVENDSNSDDEITKTELASDDDSADHMPHVSTDDERLDESSSSSDSKLADSSDTESARAPRIN